MREGGLTHIAMEKVVFTSCNTGHQKSNTHVPNPESRIRLTVIYIIILKPNFINNPLSTLRWKKCFLSDEKY
jgi:hypothetical protein